jgi:phage shock protein A
MKQLRESKKKLISAENRLELELDPRSGKKEVLEARTTKEEVSRLELPICGH